MNLKRSEILPGVFLNTLHTEKFKTDTLTIQFLTGLNRDTISRNALLPRVLLRGSMFHPDMESISAACDEFYGAEVGAAVRKRGEILGVGLHTSFISDRFVPDGKALTGDICAFLCELLLSPATTGGLLKKEYVESEKEKLIDDIRAKINDKRVLATNRLVEEMFAYEDYGCDDMGTEEAAAAVNYVDLTRYYRDLIRTAPVEILYCGSTSHKALADNLSDALATLPRGEIDYDLGTDVRMNAIAAEPRYFEDRMDVTQGKLCLGFRLGDCMEDPDPAAVGVFNALYGGGVMSKLFLNVREKLSLCYYASSACDIIKGIMIVSSGVEFSNFERARDEILLQLEHVKTGDFTEEELDAARVYVANSLRTVPDSPGLLENFYYSQTLQGLDYGPEELAALIETVSRDEVIAVASGIELDAIYFLRNQDPDEDEAEDEDGEAEEHAED